MTKIPSWLTVDFFFSIVFGLLFGFFFGLIDSTLFMMSQLNLSEYFTHQFREPIVVNLMEGSISACISLAISYWIEMQTVGYGVNIMKHPLLDCLGILLGALMVSSLILYFKHRYSKCVSPVGPLAAFET